MGSLKTLALSSLALAGATAVASAADLRHPVPHPMPPVPVAAPIVETSGWYLRGDLGFGTVHAHKWDYNDLPPGFTYSKPKIDQQIFGGIGAGYQFNNWFRADVTGELRGATALRLHDRYTFTDTRIIAGVPTPVTGEGFNNIRSNLSSWVFLANAYVDLGTWYGITPFVGIGVGVAQNRTGRFNDTGHVRVFETANPANVLESSATTGTWGGASKTNLAYALMAGLAYDVTPNYKVELGYRYLHLGDAKSGLVTCGGGCNATLRVKDLDSHEFRLGMRWLLGAPAAPIMAPPPLIKRY